jgi:Colicin E5 ribonuclease domain
LIRHHLLLCVLASLLVQGIASASTIAGAETGVRACSFAERAGLEAEVSLTQRELHWGYAPTYDKPLTADFLVPRGKLNIPSAGRKFNQIERRGWSEASIRETVQNPHATSAATNKATGNSATAYFNSDGTYVVIDDVTGDLVQLSDRTNPGAWVPDPTIQDPYLPPE